VSLRTGRAAQKAWSGLQAPWPTALALAWEAFRSGSIPIGAVVVDVEGEVAGRARDRVYDPIAPSGLMANTRLAHAELGALSHLTPHARHEDHTLFVTVEPCAMCVGALAQAAVGTCRYLAADPYAGAAGQVPVNPLTARSPIGFEGPDGGAAGAFAAVLHLEPFLRLNPGAAVVQAHRRAAPDLVAVAEELSTAEVFTGAMARQQPVQSVFAAAWPALSGLAG
jgi:tRNA(Arg) A34 adenosine deaminase TadA